MEPNERAAHDLAAVRAAIAALAHDRGVDPPANETFAEFLRFLQRLDVHPSQFFLGVFFEPDDGDCVEVQ